MAFRAKSHYNSINYIVIIITYKPDALNFGNVFLMEVGAGRITRALFLARCGAGAAGVRGWARASGRGARAG